MRGVKNILRVLSLLVAILAAGTAPAQTLLYQWNLNNATGTGTTLTAAPSVIDGSMTGGVLTNLNGAAGLAVPAGSGVYGPFSATDLGLVNSTAYRSTAGLLGTRAGDLSSVSAFTVSLWFNLNATVTNFSTLNGGALLSRLVNIATTVTGDGDELYFALNTGTNLQFGVNRANTGTVTATNQFIALGVAPTPATMTNTWIFVAAAYTTNSGGTVNLFTGTTTSNAVPVATMTNVGSIAWSATTNFIFIGNNGGGQRSLPGAVDNVNLFSGAMSLAQVVNVQTNIAVSTNAPTAGVPVISPSSTIFLGSSITITSAFGGLAPLSLQWQTDGGGALTNIPGATNATLTTTPFKTGTFKYDLVVTNSYGSATSAVAVVTVNPAPGTANVIVNVASNLSTVATNAYGIGTATYDNQNGNAALPGQLIQSGVNTLRYPGGGYADIFHWSVSRPTLGSVNGNGYSPWSGGGYAYMGPQTDFGNFVKLLSNAQCQAIITINHASGQLWGNAGHTNLVTPSTNAEPPEAAAWVAYANSVTNIFGTTNDVTIGFDSLGNDWKTAGHWAMLRAASPLGVDDGYNFLRLGRKNPVGIKLWEIGNENFGTGYYSSGGSDGYCLNYAVPYPYTTYPRYGNAALSPATYGRNVKLFSEAMKAVDPTIKIGAVVTTPPDDYSWDVYGGQHWTPQVLAQCVTNFDFVIAHWYPYAGSLDDGDGLLATVPAKIPTMIVGSGAHTGANAGLRDYINAVRPDGTNVDIVITEFGYTGSLTNALNNTPVYGPVNAMFCADSYATWMEFGVTHIDWLEMNKNTFLGDSNPLVRGAAYYAIQLTHTMAGVGDQLVGSTSDIATLRSHAAIQQNGKVGVMLLNESITNTLTVTVTIPNYSSLASTGTVYFFGTNNFGGTTNTPFKAPTTNTVAVSGNSLTVVMPAYTIAVVTVPLAPAPANTPPSLAAISNFVVNVGQTVAFTASATDTDAPPQTLTFTLLSGQPEATLNTNSGAFSYRPPVIQSGATNQFSLKVADNGTPSLSATQSFSVIVNPLAQPGLSVGAVANGQASFTFSGTSGPDYAVQTSTNLTQWATVFTTNSPAMPFGWTDTGATNPLQFYRLIVGPPLP